MEHVGTLWDPRRAAYGVPYLDIISRVDRRRICGRSMRAERTRAVTATLLHAVFCTRRVCYESSCIAERAGTATHHHYRRYNLDYISNYKTFACMQVRARRRPQRALGRARAALPGPGTTSHHPQASPSPPAAVSLPPRRPNGRNLTPRTGTEKRPSADRAAGRPRGHRAGVGRGPARTTHATHTAARAAGVPGRLHAPVVAYARVAAAARAGPRRGVGTLSARKPRPCAPGTAPGRSRGSSMESSRRRYRRPPPF